MDSSVRLTEESQGVWAIYEVARLRRGLQQIVDGDYPTDAWAWARAILADSFCVDQVS